MKLLLVLVVLLAVALAVFTAPPRVTRCVTYAHGRCV
jgi:hypothetical protein